MSRWRGIRILVLIIVSLGSIAATDDCALEDERAAEAGASGPAVAVTAEQLSTDYDANELAADEKYERRMLRINGIIAIIGERGGDANVLLSGGRLSLINVQCVFDDAEREALLPLAKGDNVTLEGWGDGLQSRNVIVRDCVVVSVH